MKDLTKHLFANFKLQFEGSNAERETQAYALKDYRIHLKGIEEKEKIVGKLAARYHKLERQFEAVRSLNKNV